MAGDSKKFVPAVHVLEVGDGIIIENPLLPFPPLEIAIDDIELQKYGQTESQDEIPRSSGPWYLRTGKRVYKSRTVRITGLILLFLTTVWFVILMVLIKTPWYHLADVGPLANNGLRSIVDTWQSPNDSIALLSPWRSDFSQGITPIPCHSHNDEQQQRIPLFTALAVGCSAIEADIHPNANTDNILVGHSPVGLNAHRTLQTLYLNPLLTILQNQNQNDNASTGSSWVGVYDNSPNTSLILMLDFKALTPAFWTLVEDQLKPLRTAGFLTHWANNTLTRGAITVVASGDATLDVVTSNSTYRDIFLDAPLLDISNSKYDTTNSYYASTPISKATGYLFFGRYSKTQQKKIKSQIDAAVAKGLVSRYWGTINRPMAWRYVTWSTLVNNKVGILNVDDLYAARRWNWPTSKKK